MPNELIAAGLIIFRKPTKQSPIEYLLLQTSYGEHHWTPPKGHCDKGENQLETAIRETVEEANLVNDKDYKIIDLNFKIELNYKVNNKQKLVVYWLANLLKPEESSNIKLSDEHIDYKWLKLNEAVVYAKYDDMKSALETAEDYINKYFESIN